MATVVLGMTMSLDGFINDRNGNVGNLYPDMAELRETELIHESIRNTGAVIMGRHAYDMAHGDFTGYEYQVPIFIVTHHVPETTAKGENENLKFHFVGDGIESAIAQAKAAAGDKIVTIIGGANIAQQCINAGVIDEIEVGIVPVLLGGGLHFFEHINRQLDLEKIRVLESAGRTDILFRVVKDY